MRADFLDHPDWYLAMTLAERSGAGAALGLEPGAGSPEPGALDRARRRLQRWKAQRPFTDEDLFLFRLGRQGLTEEQLLALLAEPAERVMRRFPERPEWLTALGEALSAWTPENAPIVPSAEALKGQETAGFLVAVAPIMRRGQERLRAGARALRDETPDLPFDPERVDHLFYPALATQLVPLISRTFVLELNVARVEGHLPGETPGERFRAFLESLARLEAVLPLLQEYNVLARQVMRAVERWTETSLELLRRLRDDLPAIRAAFCPEDDPGRLVAVECGAGDRHRGGRAVAVLRFESGFCLVYKPRSLAVERHFQELLAWLNARGAAPGFRTLTVLDRGEHGWVECVSRRPCGSPVEVERFHERLGGYLALLYALEATDFHCENLMADGEHPLLLDLETLFQPRISAMSAGAGDDMEYSVLRVGLLPQRVWQSAQSEGVDLSGLGSTAGQLTPHAVATLEGEGTDEMRVTRRRVVMEARPNRPILDGEEAGALDYVDAITEGFTRTYELLLEHREALLAPGGPLAAFAGDEVRAILRPSQLYALLLRESSHPDVLRNALDRDRFFDRLWGDVPRAPHLLHVIDAERRDLENGDIPHFTARPNACDLWTTEGARIPDFFEQTGMALVEARLRRLGAEDQERQRWFILASLATLPQGPTAPLPAPGSRPPASGEEQRRSVPGAGSREPGAGSATSLIDTARAVGDRLAALARWEGDEVSWVGLTSRLDERDWMVLPLGPDLYGGLAGVALFLAHLGAITGEVRHTELARAALRSLSRQAAETRGDRDGRQALRLVGGFLGWGGVIYTYAHLGALWQEPALLATAAAHASLLPPLIEADEYLDVVLGSAGCIGGLISLYRCRPSRAVLQAAIQCGERLLSRATRTQRGLGWITPASAGHSLAGFSHGASGYAWALLELAALTGQERFREAALATIEDERGLFVPEAGNWRDLRHEGGGAGTFAWCHGAPGVALGRLLCLPHLDDPRVREEIAVALDATEAKGFGSSHCLCHGDLGNLETLLQAALRLGESRWQEALAQRSARVVESIHRSGCLCGVPLAVEVPGLMVGIAGIGYQLLRLAAPSRVPSVLGLAPPAVPLEKQ